MLMPQAENLVKGFVERSEAILGDNLAGVYLHGSAVMGCLNPGKSDLDLIVVVNRPLSVPVKRAYLDMTAGCSAAGPAKGVEMSVVLRDVCRPFVYPTPFELHFSEGHRRWYTDDPDGLARGMNGVDRDLAAHFTVILRRGRCLYGPPAAEMFAEVPGRDCMDSILNDIADAPERIAEDTMYLVLNLARALAYKEEGLVLSKKEGGEWAARCLPPEYRPLVANALREYTESADVAYDTALAGRYAGYVLRRIQQ